MKHSAPLMLMLTLTTHSALHAATGAGNDERFWAGNPDTATFERLQDNRLARADAALVELLSVQGKRTIENTLRPYDAILLELDAVGSQGDLIANVHPDPAMRSVAEKTRQKSEIFYTSLLLNRQVYDALNAIDLTKADDEIRYCLEKTRREFRLAGVEESEDVQKQIKALRGELVVLEQEFSNNIRTDSRTVVVDNLSELGGLPSDYLARHTPDASGHITLTTSYADLFPVLSYAKSDDLRRKLWVGYRNRAYPMNMAVLDRLIVKRHELAALLRFSSWADYVTADKMVGTAKNASDFLDQIAAASKARAESEYQALLKRKQRDFPEAVNVTAWEVDYWSEKLKLSEYNFDSQELRAYFPYQQVKQGIFNVVGRLFGVTFQKLKDAPVWHPSVECWEVLEEGRLLGRFYLDMHPRPDKYNHAARFPIRTGVAGRQVPESALVCNFPGDINGDPGLMEHDEVKTFFHEFGHLIHSIFAGHLHWIGTSGTSTEADFLEAPSQMLEEWMWDSSTLQLFAKHYKTEEPIPPDLLSRAKRANEFGKGSYVRSQIVYAKMSLLFHVCDPSGINTDRLATKLTNEYNLFGFVEGTHFQCSFTHLEDFSALVYTYLWSHVIAKDMFSQFDRSFLLDPVRARRYRDLILSPGGSMSAAALIKNFLGRPFNSKAWQDWLDSN